MYKYFSTILLAFLLGVTSVSGYSQGTIKDKLMHTGDYSYAGEYRQLPLQYAYSGLEPYIDAATMEIHYSKHHAAYTANLNKAVNGQTWASLPLFDIFQEIEKYPVSVRNNGGGYYNHLLFWQLMKPNGGGLPAGKLFDAIKETFGSFEKFQSEFNTNASTRFGSGWAWLSVNEEGKLFVSSTANQDNPLMSTEKNQGIPVLCIDVWEHAYYLKYQNKRTDYVKSFWNVVNWDEVSRRYEEALKAFGK